MVAVSIVQPSASRVSALVPGLHAFGLSPRASLVPFDQHCGLLVVEGRGGNDFWGLVAG